MSDTLSSVLHVSYGDFEGAGGTSFAMYRLHRGLLDAGITSKIACRMKSLKSEESVPIRRTSTELLLRRLFGVIGLTGLEGIGSFQLKKFKVFRDADLIHLHSIHSGFFNYLALPAITSAKPAVWTVHDLWAVTGHCSFSYDCERWKTGCGRCPYPAHYPPVQRDNTALEWKLKRWTYGRSRLHLVAASEWFAGVLRQSILGRFPVTRIPWGVDAKVYRPIDPGPCRQVIGLPAHKKVILFGAANAKVHNKGADLLIDAVQRLPESLKRDLVLLTIGYRAPEAFAALKIPALHLGYTFNDYFKAAVYSAADVFVLPTRAETFSLMTVESMACGTPVVSSDVGPLPELVRDGVTGFTFPLNEAQLFADRIERVLTDPTVREAMSRNAREAVLKEYTIERQTDRYLGLYREVLGNTDRAKQ